MSGVRGLVAGVMGLTLMEAMLSTQQATDNVTGLIGFVSHGMNRWLNPYLPLIPWVKRPPTISGSVGVPGLLPFNIPTSYQSAGGLPTGMTNGPGATLPIPRPV